MLELFLPYRPKGVFETNKGYVT